MPRTLHTVPRRRQRGDSCTDPVVGAILSGWRYDISGISPQMRGDYEDHLAECALCRRRQRVHRTVDVLLLTATSLSFAAFLLAALVIRRLEAATHIEALRLHIHTTSAVLAHIPPSITISLKVVALAGMAVSLLLWVLIAIATPIPSVVTGYIRERVSPETRERLFKHAA